METEEIVPTLVKAFGVLDEEEKGNLRWHREHGSKILCGDGTARMFYVVDGVG